MKNGFYRVASCIPAVAVADTNANCEAILAQIREVAQLSPDLIVFPEMCVTAYTCADLFHSQLLIASAEEAVKRLVEASRTECSSIIVVGAPLLRDGAMYNCAIAIAGGEILTIVPKTYVPNYNEFYEKRWWTTAPEKADVVEYAGCTLVPFRTGAIIDDNGVKVAIEICEDLWTPIPPSCRAAMAGAHVIANLSASDDLIGKYAYLRSLIAQQSARCICAYVYSSAGYGESSTDLVFDGKAIIAENGTILAANERWHGLPQYSICDVDIEAIKRDRMHMGSFHDCALKNHANEETEVVATLTGISKPADGRLLRKVNPLPFVPPTDEAMADRCSEIINIQAAGLAKRLDFIHSRKIVVGISGGLDSTLALLVAVKTFDRLGLDRKGIIGITMPGFGTSARTKGNAVLLMQQLGITSREISIDAAVRQHFADISHDPAKQDVTYENSQARERTQILMDVANQENGIVLGTGDLSELALGWATYNGDHMSMYAVNCSIPKTLVRHLVRYFAMEPEYAASKDTLLDIIGTPISPELIPADDQGEITQKTEDLVGPYELHDFFLYYTLRYGFSPARIALLAREAFDGQFTAEERRKWLVTFFKRFFQQQFKRSCLPDGPKVGSVCLSPRGDWRMPSDASAQLWLDEASTCQI